MILGHTQLVEAPGGLIVHAREPRFRNIEAAAPFFYRVPDQGKDQTVNERAWHRQRGTLSEQRTVFFAQSEIIKMHRAGLGATSPGPRVRSITDPESRREDRSQARI